MKILWLILLSICIIISNSFGQDTIKQSIDSINHLPYHLRILTNKSNENTYLKIIETANKINYKKGVADAHANLALIYFYRGDKSDVSLHHLIQANTFYESQKMYEASANLTAMYGYMIRKKDINKAEKFMQEAIRKAEAIGADFSLLGMYDNYGVIKQSMHDYDSAMYFFTKALLNKKKAHDTIGIPYSYNKLAMLYVTLGKNELGKQYLDSAYATRLQMGDSIGIAENLNFYGQLYQKLGQHQKSVYYYEQALQMSKAVGYKNLIKNNYEALAQVLEAAQDYKNALYYYKQFSKLNDSLNQENIQINREQLEVAFETAEKEKQILVQRAALAESYLSIEKKHQQVIIIGSLLLISIILGYNFYNNQKQKNIRLTEENKLKEALLAIETQEQLHQQRLKISRDLHDNIGAQLTFIISSIDNLSYVLESTQPSIKNKLASISEFTQSTILELRDTIWAMNQDSITFESLKWRINNYISNATSIIDTHNIIFDIEDDLLSDTLNALEGMNLYRTIQEGVNNAIKHAAASTIKIIISRAHNPSFNYAIKIMDDGTGLNFNEVTEGNGLNNMKNRIAAINGVVQFLPSVPHGTCIEIMI